MSHFEFISVGIAIVVSFGVVRLLDGGNYAVDRKRCYWPHLVWVMLKLLQHFNIWWLLWAKHDVSWSYAGFLAQLVSPVVLYLQATALVTTSPQSIESWREHFYLVRRRFFGLNIAFAFANPLASVAAGLETQIFAPFVVVAISAVGLLSESHRVHAALAVFALLANVVLVATLTLNAATSPFG
jgi:hypothetical protein